MDSSIEKEAQIAKIETAKIATEGGSLVIRKDADLKAATDMLLKIKTTQKNIKSKKDPIIKNLNASIKEIRALFKPAEDSLAEAEQSIKSAMLRYQEKVEAKAAKNAAKIEEKVDSGELTLAEGMTKLGSVKQAPTKVDGEAGGVSFREGPRKVRITDAAALPASYLLRPRVIEALRLEVSEDVLKNGMECPAGAEVYREKQVAGRI